MARYARANEKGRIVEVLDVPDITKALHPTIAAMFVLLPTAVVGEYLPGRAPTQAEVSAETEARLLQEQEEANFRQLVIALKALDLTDAIGTTAAQVRQACIENRQAIKLIVRYLGRTT